jgi:AAA domain-containing protein
VLYVAAEGLSGLPKRIKAWEERRGAATPQNAFWLPEAAPLLNDQGIALLETYVAELRPRLIVLDTLARCMVGGDENSAKDVGRAVDNADRLRRASGATVLLIHHTTKDGGSYRGSSALEGAVDVALEVTAEGDLVTITCTKAKDTAPFEPIRLQAVPTGDSVVLKEWRHGAALKAGEAKAVAILAELFGDIDVTPAQWREACGYGNRNDNSFLRIRKALVEQGFVANVGTRQRPLYRITDEGCRHVANMSPTQNGDNHDVANTRHPLGMATGDMGGDKTSVIEAANRFLDLDGDLW